MATLYSNADALAPNRVVISDQTVSSAMFASVTFPAGYREIEITLSGLRSPASAYYDRLELGLNGNTTDGDYPGMLRRTRLLSSVVIWGLEAINKPYFDCPAATGTATDDNMHVLSLIDYAETTLDKTIFWREYGEYTVSGSDYRYIGDQYRRFASTAAITSIGNYTLTSGQTTLTAGRLRVVGIR